jgi:hypothetical protein
MVNHQNLKRYDGRCAMDGRRFDDLVRDAAAPAASRRGVVFGLAAGVVALALGTDDVGAGRRRRRRRRNRRRNVRVCFKGREIVVNRVAARELVSRGAQRGTCRVVPGDETCENATLPCDVRLTTCGGEDSDCFCFITTIGESFCAANGIECFAGDHTCITDDDCTDRLGRGARCVPTLGCGDELPGCTDTSNACAQPCQGS